MNTEELTKTEVDVFEFYTQNTGVPMSTKNIQNLRSFKTFTTTCDEFDNVLWLDESRFVPCSYDVNIEIWNYNQAFPEKVLYGHTDAVTSMIKLQNGKLCSISEDGTLKLWDIEKSTCEKSISIGYDVEFNALVELPKHILIAGGFDQICFWDLEATIATKACTRILPNKGICSTIILLSSKEMACGSDNNINIFEIYGSYLPIKSLRGHTGNVSRLLLHPNRQSLLSRSNDETMRMWNIQRGCCIRTLPSIDGHNMIWFNKSVIVTAHEYEGIKFWNVYTGECLRALALEDPIGGLTVDSNGMLISYGEGPAISYFSD